MVQVQHFEISSTIKYLEFACQGPPDVDKNNAAGHLENKAVCGRTGRQAGNRQAPFQRFYCLDGSIESVNSWVLIFQIQNPKQIDILILTFTLDLPKRSQSSIRGEPPEANHDAHPQCPHRFHLRQSLIAARVGMRF
jgi:hypothetical protein